MLHPLPTNLTLEQAMQRAIIEAKKGWGRVYHNPLVGCVVLNPRGELLSTGYHTHFGGPHAEVHAIQKLNPSELIGAHVVVTLEPCSHHGKTPACAEMLAKLPIASVTYGAKDPNPLVSGKGIEILKRAGKQVVPLQSYQRRCEELAEIFLYNMRFKKPFVALKVAMTEDESIAHKDSAERLMLTNELSTLHVHYLRAQYDAILIGKNTLLMDNPKLNIRHPDFQDKKNNIIVLDPQGELLERTDLNIYKYHNKENIFFVCDTKRGEQIITLPKTDHGLDLEQLLAVLYDKGIRSVFVEGGSYTFKSFLEKNLLQRIYIFKTPHRLFEKGVHWNQGYKSLENLQISEISKEQLGDNLFLTGVYGK